MCRWGLWNPKQLLKHAEHALTRRGLQTVEPFLRGSQALKSVRGSSAVFVSHPNNRLRQLNFLEPLIPSGHSPLYYNRSGIWPLTAVHNKAHLNDLMMIICWQIHTIITIPRVFFVSVDERKDEFLQKYVGDWLFPLRQTCYYFYH